MLRLSLLVFILIFLSHRREASPVAASKARSRNSPYELFNKDTFCIGNSDHTAVLKSDQIVSHNAIISSNRKTNRMNISNAYIHITM